MFKGPTGPQTGRTPRTQAEKIGTDSSGFVNAPDYNAQGGHPNGAGMPGGVYTHNEPASPDAGPLPTQPNPIK